MGESYNAALSNLQIEQALVMRAWLRHPLTMSPLVRFEVTVMTELFVPRRHPVTKPQVGGRQGWTPRPAGRPVAGERG
jgi:hypothetical protein